MDVGFGDVITPGPTEIDYPSLLGSPDTTLLGYPPETAIAEKVEAMVVLELANSRLKDYFDAWVLSRRRSFDGSILQEAIAATFERRKTPLPTTTPPALTTAFVEAPGKQAQWAGWLRKSRIGGPAPPLDEVVTEVRAFLAPILSSLATGEATPASWVPGGPWAGTEPRR